MAGTGEGKKEEAEYKRLHSFPLIRVRHCVCVHMHISIYSCTYVAIVVRAAHVLVIGFAQGGDDDDFPLLKKK